MLNNSYIDKLLHSEERVFIELLEKIDNKIIENAQQELAIEYKINSILFESIEFILQQLKEEEGFLSRILYKSFGVGREKNRKRGQLIFLGNQVLEEINQFERNRSKIKFHHKNVLLLLTNLEEFAEIVSKRSFFSSDKDIEKKAQNYLKQIYLKIDEANSYLQELHLRYIYIESCLYKYDNLLKKIPRNQELKRSNFLLSS